MREEEGEGARRRNVGCHDGTEDERRKRRSGRSRMPLRDPQTRIPLPSLAATKPGRVRDEMTKGAIGEKGRAGLSE